jgi:hypothetical protein
MVVANQLLATLDSSFDGRVDPVCGDSIIRTNLDANGVDGLPGVKMLDPTPREPFSTTRLPSGEPPRLWGKAHLERHMLTV